MDKEVDLQMVKRDIESIYEMLSDMQEHIRLVGELAKTSKGPVEALGKEVYRNIIPTFNKYEKRIEKRLRKLEDA